jgi:cell division septation protein DedD
MTIRDADRFKDKIEVSLDSRQLFFLFFGGTVVACLVFVLGVMVGKRLEGRERVAHKAATSAQVDPLAALDELGADEQADEKGEDLAFASALAEPASGAKRTAPVDPPSPGRSLQPDGVGAIVQTARAVAAALAAAQTLATAAEPDKPSDKPSSPSDKPSSDKPASDKDKAKHDGKKGKFTLQISSFQERAEADALLARLGAGGYKPYIVTSNVADKGIFFRVRIGEFGSKSDAQDAKSDFEKKEHLLAYVTKL